MKPLVILYLMTTATHIVPLIAVTITLQYGTVFPFLPRKWRDRPPVKHGLRHIGAARCEQFFQFFDSDLKDYLTKLCLVACYIEVVTVNLIVFAIECDVPIPFAPNIDKLLAPGSMIELLLFAIITNLIQLIPLFLLSFALDLNVPIPFLPSRPVHPKPPIIEITYWEQEARPFASMCVTRYETLAKTYFFGKCRDDRSGAVFKLALSQGIEGGARTECYMYDEHDQNLERIVPAPIGVGDLEEIFSPEDV